MEPDAWLSMDDACDRLLRLQGWDPRDTEADLLAGRVLFTPYASYMLDPDASA